MRSVVLLGLRKRRAPIAYLLNALGRDEPTMIEVFRACNCDNMSLFQPDSTDPKEVFRGVFDNIEVDGNHYHTELLRYSRDGAVEGFESTAMWRITPGSRLTRWMASATWLRTRNASVTSFCVAAMRNSPRVQSGSQIIPSGKDSRLWSRDLRLAASRSDSVGTSGRYCTTFEHGRR
jgi:hypothetical protein